MDLTDEQWTVIKALLPAERRRSDGRGRPWKDTRLCSTVFFGFYAQAHPGWTCRIDIHHTRHAIDDSKHGSRDGTLIRVLQALAEDLRDRGRIDLSECFIDGTFVPAKKGGFASVKLSGARARRSWQLQTALVFLSRCTWPALARMKSSLPKPLSSVGSSKKPLRV